MGVKERQGREREAVGRAILDAARDLFVAEGYHNVSIRKIAERIEYSPASIYSYFPSKDDIFFALAEEGFHILFTPLDAGVLPADPVDAIRATFWRVYEFSKSHPEYYALMFVDRTVPRISKDWQRFGFVREGRRQLGAVIQQAIDLGRFPPATNSDAVFRILGTAIHGAAVGRLCNRLMPGEDPDALALDTLEATLTGLRQGIPMTFRPGPCEHMAESRQDSTAHHVQERE
ncbi:MAG TPA: TetR/AcrR family transcriptional regulator [Vicinamibacterales bacterium]|nr:TetR/AcrR family transcriptional regulator [Vicinamibacterales bacterium]